MVKTARSKLPVTFAEARQRFLVRNMEMWETRGRGDQGNAGTDGTFSAGCPDIKVVFFNVDSIGLEDSLPFKAPDDPEGAPGSHFEPGSWVAASIYQEG
jgi:hypothetical protein